MSITSSSNGDAVSVDTSSVDSSQAHKLEMITRFVETNPQYYAERFEIIGAKTRFVWTFNWAAALLGPIWFGMRNLWKWGLPFVMLEMFAYIQIIRGWFGDLGAEALDRVY